MKAINVFVPYNWYACGIRTAAQSSIQIIQKVLQAHFRSVHIHLAHHVVDGYTSKHFNPVSLFTRQSTR